MPPTRLRGRLARRSTTEKSFVFRSAELPLTSCRKARASNDSRPDSSKATKNQATEPAATPTSTTVWVDWANRSSALSAEKVAFRERRVRSVWMRWLCSTKRAYWLLAKAA